MARDRRSDPVGRFVIDMIGELQFGRLVRVVFQEVLWDFESRTLNGVLPLAGTGLIVILNVDTWNTSCPKVFRAFAKAFTTQRSPEGPGLSKCFMGATNKIRIVGAQREFVLPRGHLRSAEATLV